MAEKHDVPVDLKENEQKNSELSNHTHQYAS